MEAYLGIPEAGTKLQGKEDETVLDTGATRSSTSIDKISKISSNQDNTQPETGSKNTLLPCLKNEILRASDSHVENSTCGTLPDEFRDSGIFLDESIRNTEPKPTLPSQPAGLQRPAFKRGVPFIPKARQENFQKQKTLAHTTRRFISESNILPNLLFEYKYDAFVLPLRAVRKLHLNRTPIESDDWQISEREKYLLQLQHKAMLSSALDDILERGVLPRSLISDLEHLETLNPQEGVPLEETWYGSIDEAVSVVGL